MAFVQTDVNYAAEYSRALAQAYPYLSYFAAIWASENSNRYRPGMGKTMYIPSITTSGAVDVNRNQINGTFDRNWAIFKHVRSPGRVPGAAFLVVIATSAQWP